MSSLAAPPKSVRTTLCISFALIFLCGAVSGALLVNWSSTHASHSTKGHFDSRFELLHLQKELDLTDEQTRQLSIVLDDVAKYYDNVLSDGQTRLMQMLDDKQKAKFQRLLNTEGH